jgi:hypothetical protein
LPFDKVTELSHRALHPVELPVERIQLDVGHLENGGELASEDGLTAAACADYGDTS